MDLYAIRPDARARRALALLASIVLEEVGGRTATLDRLRDLEQFGNGGRWTDPSLPTR